MTTSDLAATLLDLKAARMLPGGEVEDEEDIAVQVIYTTLFLAYPLTTNVPLATARPQMGRKIA